ncbi:hypothetical protein NPIL_636491 [Nephila pilipes]|uniref:Uncharacterized protein n=1 Tax=Nephila pilipes TaxID=299642 RepID=A0A8X6P9M0_NEPPI|nr:hypothetical protein NPIL_636491 [Nephila pilipes]
MGVTQIMEWFNRFKDGCTSAESEQRCGRPQTARSAVVERVRNLVMADRRLQKRLEKSPNDKLEEYLLKTATYRTSSPILAVKALPKLAYKDTSFLLDKDVILQDFYEGNLLNGTNSISS